jgi:hypothetical protein
MQSVLTLIKAPSDSLVNIRNLQTWQRYEGGTFRNNPLNTTRPMPGSTPQPTEHDEVQNYADAASGIQATADSLLNGRYTAIVMKLRTAAPLPAWNDPSVLAQIDEWGTVDFAVYIRKLAPIPVPVPKPPIILEDTVKVVRVPNGTAYLLGGSFMIAISDGPTETLWINAGCELVDLSADTPGNVLMYQRLIAQFPPSPAA